MKSLFSLILVAGLAFTFLNCGETNNTTPDDSDKKSISDWCEEKHDDEDNGSLFKGAIIATTSSNSQDGESSTEEVIDCDTKVTEDDFDELHEDKCNDEGECVIAD